MTTDDFRRIALSFPEAKESDHMSHPDFRVREKIFATLGYPDQEHGVVILAPEVQTKLVAAENAFSAVKGFWGRRGATQVRLEVASVKSLEAAMAAAWRKVAPKRLLARTGAA